MVVAVIGFDFWYVSGKPLDNDFGAQITLGAINAYFPVRMSSFLVATKVQLDLDPLVSMALWIVICTPAKKLVTTLAEASVEESWRGINIFPFFFMEDLAPFFFTAD